MRTNILSLVLIVLAFSDGAWAGSLAGSRPNIVFVLADDLGYGDLACYGQKTHATPNLDRMAAEGLRFTRHYAGSTVCAPSRCVLMTGLHTGHCRIRGNGPGQLAAEDFTVAEMLQQAGYATACIGKWGIGNPPPLDDPARNGFGYFYGYINMYHAHNFYPEFLYRNGEKVKLRNVLREEWRAQRPVGSEKEGAGVAAQKIDYVPALLADDVLRYLEEQAKREDPFFLYYALNIPHANNEGGRGAFGVDGMEVPDLEDFADKEWPNAEKGFASMIRHIDRDVGAILAKLGELGIAEETIVFFSSDNGPHQEGGHEVDYFDSNGELRGKKRDLYEGGVRVPLIAWAPGRVAAGGESDHVSAFQDFLPTAAELAGVEAPGACDGISMVATLAGDAGGQEKHEALYWEFLEQGGKKAVLVDGWKGVRLDTVKSPEGPLELYRVEEDVAEESDVAADHPDVAARIEAIMAREHTPQE